MQKAVSTRRLLVCVGVSMLVHAPVFVRWPRPPAAEKIPAVEAAAVSFDPLTPVPAARMALVGERPSGRGRVLAGSNAHTRGSPWHGPRTRSAVGQAEATGSEAAVVTASSNAGSAPPEDASPSAAPAAGGEVTIPAPAAPAPTSDTAMPPPQPTVDADRAFDELARAQRMRLSKGNGGGLAGFGRGNGGTGVGLTTELFGQRRPDTPVVAAPVIVKRQPVECELPATLHLLAIVRVLVTREGSTAVPRILQTSGYAGFDRCALAYVLALRFSPGMDANDKPLDVWMNVRVAPTTMGELEDAR